MYTVDFLQCDLKSLEALIPVYQIRLCISQIVAFTMGEWGENNYIK